MVDIFGGSYEQCKGGGGEGHHVYYWSAYDGVLGFTKKEGPSIRMDKQDHRRLLSSGGKPGSNNHRHRQEQRSLLEQGQHKEAWNLAVSNILTNPNIEKGKYNHALSQAEGQLLKLNDEKKIQLNNKFKSELQERQVIRDKLEQHLKEGKTKEITAKRAELQTAYNKVCLEYTKNKTIPKAQTQQQNSQTIEEKMNASRQQAKQQSPSGSVNKEQYRQPNKPQINNHKTLTVEQKMNASISGKTHGRNHQTTFNNQSSPSKSQIDKTKNNTHHLGL